MTRLHEEAPPPGALMVKFVSPSVAEKARPPRRQGKVQAKETDLRAVAAMGSCDEARALAAHGDLDEGLVELLARRAEPEIARALAHNVRARLGRKILRGLMERGRDDAVLARALLQRDDLHLCHLRLFLQADAEERGHLIAIARRSRLATLPGRDGLPRPDARKRARLELCSLNHEPEEFRRALAHALACELSQARRIADDEGGEALALALAALGLPYEIDARILLTALPRTCASAAKFRCLMRIVESVKRRAAARMIRAIVGAPLLDAA